jgi:hypothetical protein
VRTASDGRAAYGPRAAARVGGAAARVDGAQSELRAVVRWYFTGGGPGTREAAAAGAAPATLPFYCDAARVGAFAVAPAELAAADEAALFRLFVCLAMYQALRDVIIMRRQRALSADAVASIAELPRVAAEVQAHRCAALRAGDELVGGCDVAKAGGRVDCRRHRGAACPVKAGTRAFRRMGDMGKLPASAWLELWQGGGIGAALAAVCAETDDPRARAARMVARIARVHRVGRKLATMYVSALSTPALAPGLTPWWPALDGNDLCVVDTNVARAVDVLRGPGAARTYDARAQWLREQARRIDLRAVRADLPRTSPRLVQEALYAFGSRSNRAARADACAAAVSACASCARRLCPFVAPDMP